MKRESILGPSSIPKVCRCNSSSCRGFRAWPGDWRLFFDYNGNGTQDREEPSVPGVLVQLKDYVYGKVVAETLTDSSGDYRFEDIKMGSPGMDYVFLHLGLDNLSDKKFTYMCTSPNEFRAVTEDYGVSLQESVRMDVGLMEGFLTLSMLKRTHCEIDRFYDRDPNPDRYLWWNGKKGLDSQPASMKRGWAPNHAGIDYYLKVGEPILAAAPGVVSDYGDDPQGKYVWVSHPNGMATDYGHISKATVPRGASVSRGEQIAESGKSGKNTELANYPHCHFHLRSGQSVSLDPYRALFQMTDQLSGYYDYSTGKWIATSIDLNPNMRNYWTKDNDPQYAMT